MTKRHPRRGPIAPADDSARLEDLTAEERAQLVSWARRALRPRKTPLDSVTSYDLKHVFERAPGGFYVVNGAFKGAMVEAGFEPVDAGAVNWTFRLSLPSVEGAHAVAVDVDAEEDRDALVR